MEQKIRNNPLIIRANALYQRLPKYLQFTVDESEDSGLEPEEIPDGYERGQYGANT